MKVISKIVFLLLIFLSNFNVLAGEAFYGYADFNLTQRGDTSVYGSANVNRGQFENLVLMGDLNFKKLKVTETLTINGAMQGEELDCKNLVLNGMLTGKRIIIRDSAVINGGLDVVSLDVMKSFTMNLSEKAIFKAKGSNFKNITVSAKKIELDESIVESITFEKSDNTSELFLSGGSLVKGDIIFKSGNGKVFKSADSIIDGKVKGGGIVENYHM